MNGVVVDCWTIVLCQRWKDMILHALLQSPCSWIGFVSVPVYERGQLEIFQRLPDGKLWVPKQIWTLQRIWPPRGVPMECRLSLYVWGTRVAGAVGGWIRVCEKNGCRVGYRSDVMLFVHGRGQTPCLERWVVWRFVCDFLSCFEFRFELSLVLKKLWVQGFDVPVPVHTVRVHSWKSTGTASVFRAEMYRCIDSTAVLVHTWHVYTCTTV